MTKKTNKTDKFTVKDFFKRFQNDDACLKHIMEVRYGLRHICQKCGVEGTFHKLENRKAYCCAHCGDNLYPCAGTIFQDSRTSLQTWFYAIYLFVTTRHGVSGKELQRTLGVTYKCAHRMGHNIRILMKKADGFHMLQGHVELDETYVGGAAPAHRRNANKTIVMGLKQRGGPIVTTIIPDAKRDTLKEVVNAKVERGSTVNTDEWKGYALLNSDGYKHRTVTHSLKQYVRGDHHVNNVESFWRLFKASVKGTHVHVSAKYMQRYLNEFTFRSNHRKMVNGMFDLLIGAV